MVKIEFSGCDIPPKARIYEATIFSANGIGAWYLPEVLKRIPAFIQLPPTPPSSSGTSIKFKPFSITSDHNSSGHVPFSASIMQFFVT